MKEVRQTKDVKLGCLLVRTGDSDKRHIFPACRQQLPAIVKPGGATCRDSGRGPREKGLFGRAKEKRERAPKEWGGLSSCAPCPKAVKQTLGPFKGGQPLKELAFHHLVQLRQTLVE
ncbi:uncharacterized protein CIMG_11360 [Coccidioides immitis RS]|uniref:Uncharacterized protein n=2 Tax=Coccidioides immitis TaxID=5501 RepID=J3KDX0_COCIM|nr:uncharacterized protein CIMG_11360 [Coccidioides immitis RS]EAS33619.3 hypothetical protein CIMG_11360 [Coccidioides immitis RS]KMP04803.1 hypothetical protein CIRG_04484 [Coccidioides immitis RMSCC 2394]